jgi:hypothetical protein
MTIRRKEDEEGRIVDTTVAEAALSTVLEKAHLAKA